MTTATKRGGSTDYKDKAILICHLISCSKKLKEDQSHMFYDLKFLLPKLCTPARTERCLKYNCNSKKTLNPLCTNLGSLKSLEP